MRRLGDTGREKLGIDCGLGGGILIMVMLQYIL